MLLADLIVVIWVPSHRTYFPFTMFVSPGLCGGVQQLRLVDLHRHHLSNLLRAHTDALCLCLAIGELDLLSFGSQTQVRA